MKLGFSMHTYKMRYSHFGKKSNGFTLVEVLLSLAIVGVMILMYQIIPNSLLIQRNVKDKDIALRIATNKMEELRALGYAQLPVSGSFTDQMLSSLPSGTAAMAITDYNQKTKQVSITVSWTEPNTQPGSVVLETLMTQTGGI